MGFNVFIAVSLFGSDTAIVSVKTMVLVANVTHKFRVKANPEDRCSMLLQNDNKYQEDYTVSKTRKQQSEHKFGCKVTSRNSMKYANILIKTAKAMPLDVYE